MYEHKDGKVNTTPFDMEILINPDCSTSFKFTLYNGQTFRVEFENVNDDAEGYITTELREPNP